MTVVLGIRFSPTSGMLIADEESSYGSRKYQLRDKLYVSESENGDLLMLGGAGHAGMIRNSIDTYERNGEFGADAFMRSMHEARFRFIDDYSFARHRLTREEYLLGEDERGVRIGSDVMSDIERMNETGGSFHEAFDNDFVLFEAPAMDLSLVGMIRIGRTPADLWYVSVGAGSDVVDGSLARTYSRIPREERDSVPLGRGVYAAMSAMNDAFREVSGVGGTPNIAIAHEGELYRPDHRSSHLATEIVRAADRGLIDGNFVHDGLESLMTQDVFDEVNTDFERAAHDGEKLALFLRGYIV